MLFMLGSEMHQPGATLAVEICGTSCAIAALAAGAEDSHAPRRNPTPCATVRAQRLIARAADPRTKSLRCAHASRGGTFGSCRLTVCVARSFGSSCTREVDASGAVSHDVGSEETVVMKNRLTVVNLQMMQLNTTCLTSRLAVWRPDCSAPVA